MLTEEQVKAIYQELWGRDPDADEIARGIRQSREELYARLARRTEDVAPGEGQADVSVSDDVYRMINRDRDSWERSLQEAADAAGSSYDSNDLEGLIRAVRSNPGADPQRFLDDAVNRYRERAQSGGDRGDGGYSTNFSDDAGIRAQQQALWGAEGEGMPDWARGTDQLNDDGGGGGGGDGDASGWPSFAPPDPLSLPDPYAYPDYEAEAPFAYDAYTPAEPFAYDPYTAPEPFAYDDFSAPTGESMSLDPGYQFRLSEGQRALDASAAARGTLRTGGHLKDTVGYGQQFASQEYGNIYDRASQQYAANRGNALQNYLTNEGNRASTYDRNLGLAQSTYGTNEANRQGAWQDNYGVAKDIYGINAAGRLGAYDINRQNAQNAYQSQYQTAGELYGSQYQTAQDKYAAAQRQAELQYGREWDAYAFGQDQDFRYWDAKLRTDTALADYGTRA
jgi:hypothetical protein